MYRSRLALFISLFSLFAVSVVAHEQATHQNLTVAALNYIQANDPARFALLQKYGSIYSTLADGAWHEDDPFPGHGAAFGRFFFHFAPNLNDLGQFGSCNSIDWGVGGSYCIAVSIPLVDSINIADDHTWADALSATNPTTGAPTALGWTHLGYLIHLLEDMTSPPHTRNSAHPCLGGTFPFCDPFEPENVLAPVNPPLQDYIGLSNLSGPQDLFQRVQSYTHGSYFSTRTVFNGDGGPGETFQDPDSANPSYFYGMCLPASTDFGTCGPNGRKIAYKGLAYYTFLLESGTADRTKAEINSVIAQEQFRELAPATVYAVAALIRLYAPMLTVQVQGSGTVTSSPGNGINCSTGTCSALFVQGAQGAPQVTLTATSGVTWGGDCASGGTNATTQVRLTGDKSCTATFATGCAAQTICGTVTDQTGQPVAGAAVVLQGSGLYETYYTDGSGVFAFPSLPSGTYLLDCLPPLGDYGGGIKGGVAPGGSPISFTVIAQAAVTITGPSGALVLFTQTQWSGPPPCEGGGCPPGTPPSISGVAPYTFNLLGSWWITCYVYTYPVGYLQTSSQQFTVKPQQSVSLSCPK